MSIRMTGFTASLTAIAALALPFAASAQDVAITNATVAIGDGSEPIEGATVVVRAGKVVAAGTGVSVPAGMATMDGTGSWVTPGIFTSLTDLGLYDVAAVGDSNDLRARNARFDAALDVAPAVNYASQHIAISRAGGVTRATVAPTAGRAIFAGQGALIDLGADPDAVTQSKAFQMVVLGETGAQIAGGSRLAAYVEFANALKEASDAAAGKRAADDALLTRADAEALGDVISGQQKLYIHVERASDISAVLDLKREYPRLDMVLVGVSEGWIVADELARSGVPVIADGLDDLPASFEQLGATQSNIGRMVAAGVTVAMGNLAGGTDGHPRTATQYAGNLVALSKVPGASGLSWGQALATITSIPAKVAGMDGQYGVLKPGAAGDVVIWDGDPLELSSAPVRVFIDGVEQPLDNHQTRLRDRYRDLDESERPKAYDW